MQRPFGITLTAILMVANLIVDVALAFFGSPAHPAPPAGRPISHSMLAFHIGLGAFVGLQLAAVAFYWLRRSWARRLVLVGCVYYLTGLIYLHRNWQRSHTVADQTVAAALLAVFLIYYLNTEGVLDWYRRPAPAEAEAEATAG